MPDNTGKTFIARGRVNERDLARMLQQYMEKPGVLRCPDCNGTEFWIYLDLGGRTGLTMFQCKQPNCKRGFMPLELHKPQMNDFVAKNLDIFVPEPWLSSAPKGSEPSMAEIVEMLESEDDVQ